MKKVYRPAGNSIVLKKSPVEKNLFYPFKHRLFQSGTASLAVAAAACIKTKATQADQSEIIIPAYACPDLVSAILHAGAKPILVDLEENSPFLSYEHVLKNITASTVAIVATNFMGLPGNISQLKEVCNKNDLLLIYDCAQWFPLEEEFKWPGNFNIISFGRGKPVSLLHGGVVIQDDSMTQNIFSDLPEENRNAINCLIQALKVRVYNFLVQPIIYRFASQLPGLNVGRTLYKPLKNISSMKSYYTDLIKANISSFREPSNSLRYLHQRIISISHPLLINIVTEELDSNPDYLLRYPILIKDKKIRNLFYEQTRNFGTSKLYQRPLNQICGLENILDQTATYPNAINFAEHLVTLPCHKDIDNKVIDIIVDKLRSVLIEGTG